MAECIILKGGGGADLDVITAGASDVLAGKVSVDKDGNPLPGAMPKIGTAIHGTGVGLNAQGVYYYIPKGFYDEPGQPNPWVYMTREEVAAAGGLTANKMISGQSAFGIAGSVNVQSILSFSAAVYSSTAITFTWQNPAKGPFSGVIMVGKTGSYPASITDGTRYYKGSGSNSAASGMSSATVTSFASGTTYYFRAFSYAIKDGAEWVSTTSYTANSIINKITQTFTSSQTWTIPAGVTSIDIFMVGGGGGGGYGSSGTRGTNAGGGGGSGYTTTILNRSVTPGTQLSVIVGSGGGGQTNGGASSIVGIASADGGKFGKPGWDSIIGNNGGGGAGGSGGGGGSWFSSNVGNSPAGDGGSDGASGGSPGGSGSSGAGQKTTTRAFSESSGTLYAGGGGGGGNAQYTNTWRGLGGSGGGGNGSDAMGTSGSTGTAGTGGGGGGGYGYTGSSGGNGYSGGSGVVLIRWYG